VTIALSAGVRRPLTLEQARAIARKRYDADGHPEPARWSSSEDEGAFQLSFSPDKQDGTLIVVVGRYTGRIASVRHEERGREGLYQMRKQ
jgi:hypothetical protein